MSDATDTKKVIALFAIAIITFVFILWCGVLYTVHILNLDDNRSDSRPPYGIMLHVPKPSELRKMYDDCGKKELTISCND